MPVFSAPQLEELTRGIFGAAGAPDDVARQVARSLVQSNLMGHDSHGVLRIESYLEEVERGTLVPAARPSLAKDTPTTAVVDGNWGFGQITAGYATKVAIQKAREANVAAVGILRCNHVGRLGEYTEMAAREGMVAFMAGAALGGHGILAPYGGAGRVMGSNPISFSVPAAEGAPVVTDMATSVVAEGKLKVARAKKQRIEPGIILDREGNPSTDPNDFYEGGVLLPFGGHKGYALSVVVDLLGRHLAPGDVFAGEKTSFGNLLVVINVEAFRPLEEFQGVVSGRLEQIKSVKLADGFTEILVPGEPERRTLARRLEEGIALPEDTWAILSRIAAKLGVALP